MAQLLRHLDYGRKLRSEALRPSFKNDIKVLIQKPPEIPSMNKKSPFDYRGKKFIKTFFTYEVRNKSKDTSYRVTLCVLNDKPVPTFNSAVQYYCGCADFKFRMAYRLREHGVLIDTKTTRNQLGKAYTDPPEVHVEPLLMCKHIYSTMQYLRRNRKWEI